MHEKPLQEIGRHRFGKTIGNFWRRKFSYFPGSFAQNAKRPRLNFKLPKRLCCRKFAFIVKCR